MTDSEVLEAIIEHQLWIHPTGAGGWTASGIGAKNFMFAWNKPTPQEAVEAAITCYPQPEEQPICI